ncbi:Mce family protein [Gordonia effusa NBRC 100432]|uniref:Mce family protein n=1 Tax=Gordonia effusa NBRC 100432 TaxID=1077974 RepID=H0QV81_9ACTN|nr:MCE family protein [Gordonia effusa]GAB16732.1 Mce family protein [Gordonia effusa NBRC 100432]
MDSRARAFRATLIKLGIFAITMILVFVALVVVFSRYRPGSSYDYSAMFTSASSMKTGAKVKIAGVEVGAVSGIELTQSSEAKVDFSVDEDYPLPSSVRALIRYENLTGDRYVELQRGVGDVNSTISPGGQIPISQTEPALDLDKLLGGFKPLFRTLNPTEVNELSESLIQVFQGQGPALTSLLKSTSQFTNSLADRDELIGQVIDNLNKTLGTLDADQQGFSSDLDRLHQLVDGLAADRTTIGQALSSTSAVTNDLASLLTDTRPQLKSLVTDTGKLADEMNKGEGYVREVLPRLPNDFKTLSNLGSYGAWLQIWLCKQRLLFTGPGNTQISVVTLDATKNSRPGNRCDNT